MEKIFVIPFYIFFLSQCSCIDRDTIAGTGKEEPYLVINTGGNLQSGAVGITFKTPISVRVLSEKDKPVRNVPVVFLVPSGNAKISDTLVLTDGNGDASTIVTLGTKADSVKILASVLGIKGSPVIFTMIARATSEDRALIHSGDRQQGVIGTQLYPLQVRVFDEFDNRVENVTVLFSTSKGVMEPTWTLTDSNGTASSFWTLDTIAGSKTATAQIPSLGDFSLTFFATALPISTPSSFTLVSEDTLIAMEGSELQNAIAVQTKDKYKNNIRGTDVIFSVTEGISDVFPTETTTSSDGIARASIFLDSASLDKKVTVQSSLLLYAFPSITVTTLVYRYIQLDSLTTSGGNVMLFWGKNTNPKFSDYMIQRCDSVIFNNTTVTVATITDVNVTSFIDFGVTIGKVTYYRIKVNFTNGFSFSSNIKQITVSP